MRTFVKILLGCIALYVGFLLILAVFGVIHTLFHFAIIAAVVLGIGYVVYSVVSPRRALESRRRILP